MVNVNYFIRVFIILLFLFFPIISINAEFVAFPKESLYFDDIISSVEVDDDVYFSYKGIEIDPRRKIIDDKTEILGPNRIRLYAPNTFLVDTDRVYTQEYGSSTKEVFYNLESKPIPLSLIRPVNAQVIYPGAGDGCIRDNTGWRDSCDAGNGSHVYGTDATGYIQDLAGQVHGRCFWGFDTSGIGSENQVDSADFLLYFKSGGVADTDGTYFTIFESTQASISSLVTADFDNFSTTTKLIADEDITTLTQGGYHTFSLNNDGINNIDVTGETKFMMTTGLTYSCTTPTGNNGDPYGHSNTETSGTSEDPYLDLTLSSSSPPAEPGQDPATTTIGFEYPENMCINNELSMVCGMTLKYSTTSGAYEVEYHYFHIPFIVWFIIWSISAFIASRIIIELIIRWRQ